MWAALWPLLAAAIGAFLANGASALVSARVRSAQSLEATRDADLSRASATIDEIVTLSEIYWTKGADGLGAEEALVRGRIVARQQLVLKIISDMFVAPTKFECDMAAMKFITSTTGGEFGPGCPAEPDRMAEVYLAGMSLQRELVANRRRLKRSWIA